MCGTLFQLFVQQCVLLEVTVFEITKAGHMGYVWWNTIQLCS